MGPQGPPALLSISTHSPLVPVAKTSFSIAFSLPRLSERRSLFLNSGIASMSSRPSTLHSRFHIPSPEHATLMSPSEVLHADVGLLVGRSLPICRGTSPFVT